MTARLLRGRSGGLSLRTRLALLAGLACVFVAVLLSLGLYVVAQQFVQQAQLARLQSAALVLPGRVRNSLAFGQYDPDDLTGQDIPADILVRVSQYGAVLIVSRQFPGDIRLDAEPGLYRLGDRYVLAQPVSVSGRTVLLTLALSSQGSDDARRAFLRAIFLILPVVLLLACLASWWAAGRMLRPVAALEQAARLVGESGDLTRPLPGVGGQDELSRLAATLQNSFRQLDQIRSREVQFLRSAAHDLRGPLAALKTRVSLSLSRERAPERYRQDLREVGLDLTRLATLAEHLLLLASNPQTLGRGPVELHGVVADALDTARSRSPDTDLDLSGEAIRVQGDRVLLGQAIGNLLQNAVLHAPGAAVHVELSRDRGEALITVRDDGPGVDAAALARLGEAFFRPDGARQAVVSDLEGGGHGLGLAIVRHVAQLHGGTLELESAPGQGFTARLRLPLEEEFAAGRASART